MFFSISSQLFFRQTSGKFKKAGGKECTAVGAVMAGRSTSVHRDLTSFALNANSENRAGRQLEMFFLQSRADSKVSSEALCTLQLYKEAKVGNKRK